VQALEVSSPENVEAYSALAKKLGTDARYVPAFFYCGRAFQGYHDDYTTGRFLRESLEACHAELVALRGTDARSAGDQASASVEQPAAPEPAPINLLFGQPDHDLEDAVDCAVQGMALVALAAMQGDAFGVLVDPHRAKRGSTSRA
jgi:hypothetical protein